MVKEEEIQVQGRRSKKYESLERQRVFGEWNDELSKKGGIV